MHDTPVLTSATFDAEAGGENKLNIEEWRVWTLITGGDVDLDRRSSSGP